METEEENAFSQKKSSARREQIAKYPVSQKEESDPATMIVMKLIINGIRCEEYTINEFIHILDELTVEGGYSKFSITMEIQKRKHRRLKNHILN
jgi:hypothetical protein